MYLNILIILKISFGLDVVVALNKYTTDLDEEIEYIKNELAKKNIILDIVEGYSKGGDGATDIANTLVNMIEEKSKENNNFKYMYELSDTIISKIEQVSTKIYGAKGINISDIAKEKIEKIEKNGYGNLPICIAKTQYSFSDDPKNLESTNQYLINVKDIELKAGAEFIVVICGNIMTMPGLPKVPAANSIGIDNNEEIVGLF